MDEEIDSLPRTSILVMFFWMPRGGKAAPTRFNRQSQRQQSNYDNRNRSLTCSQRLARTTLPAQNLQPNGALARQILVPRQEKRRPREACLLPATGGRLEGFNNSISRMAFLTPKGQKEVVGVVNLQAQTEWMLINTTSSSLTLRSRKSVSLRSTRKGGSVGTGVRGFCLPDYVSPCHWTAGRQCEQVEAAPTVKYRMIHHCDLRQLHTCHPSADRR